MNTKHYENVDAYNFNKLYNFPNNSTKSQSLEHCSPWRNCLCRCSWAKVCPVTAPMWWRRHAILKLLTAQQLVMNGGTAPSSVWGEDSSEIDQPSKISVDLNDAICDCLMEKIAVSFISIAINWPKILAGIRMSIYECMYTAHLLRWI